MIICVLWILCFWSAAKMHNPLSCNPRVLVIFSLNVDFHLQDFLIYICAKKSPLSMQMKTFSNHFLPSFLPLLCSIYHFSVNSSFLLCLPLFLLHYYLILQVFNSLVPYLLDHSSKMIKHFYPQINWPRFSFFILSLPISDCAFLYIHPSIYLSLSFSLSLSLSLFTTIFLPLSRTQTFHHALSSLHLIFKHIFHHTAPDITPFQNSKYHQFDIWLANCSKEA